MSKLFNAIVPESIGREETMSITDDQLKYYRERAPEYDDWFFRRGRYDRGPEHRAEWFDEIARAEASVLPLLENKEVIEFASGTGLWTEKLARVAKRIVAIDASPEVLTISRSRLQRYSKVHFRMANLFDWTPEEQFDVVFFSFWLSHVPEEQFENFWAKVHRSLRAGGSAVFIDSLLEPASTAHDHPAIDRSGVVRRKLNDGREFRIVKIFYNPHDLQARLEKLGWQGWVHSTPKFFLFGRMVKQDDVRT